MAATRLQAPTNRLSRGVLQILAVAMVLLGATISPPVVSVTTVLSGAVLWAWALSRGRTAASRVEHRWAGGAALAVIVGSQIYPIGPLPEVFINYRIALLALGVAAGATLFALGSTEWGRRAAMILAVLTVVSSTTLVITSEWRSPMGTDVYHAHREAGEALSSGENPYGNAVSFIEGSAVDGRAQVIEGYPYPPVALLAYGGFAWLGDPRVVSALSWLLTLGWFGLRALRESDAAHIETGIFVLLSCLPIWSVVLFVGWTEPLSLLFFVGAAALWRGKVAMSSLMLGLALASKQYFALLAPVVLAQRTGDRLKRSAVVGATIVATVLPFLLADPQRFVTALVINLANIPLRPDSQSIPGLLAAAGMNFRLPNWVWISTVTTAGLILGLGSRTTSRFFASLAATLAFAFVIGLAFPNYWFLVGGLLAVAVVLEAEIGPDRAA